MREPYNQLLGAYATHPIMEPYLGGRAPDFEGMLGSDYWPSLSTTEQLMWRIAHTFWNGGDMGLLPVTIGELGRLDRPHMWRVCAALILSRQNLDYRELREEYDAFITHLGTVDWDAVPEGR